MTDTIFVLMSARPDELPETFIEHAERRLGDEVPATFSEPDLGPGRGDDGARAAADEVRRLVLEL